MARPCDPERMTVKFAYNGTLTVPSFMQIDHAERREVINIVITHKEKKTYKDRVLDRYHVHEFFVTFYQNRTN
jgi:hypothetical protein